MKRRMALRFFGRALSLGIGAAAASHLEFVQPEDYDAIYEQALGDMRHPDFFAKWQVLTAWGTKPERAETRDFLHVR